jgi:hypothetical protein
MILSFRDRRTERFAAGERVPAFEGFRRQGEKEWPEGSDGAENVEIVDYH